MGVSVSAHAHTHTHTTQTQQQETVNSGYEVQHQDLRLRQITNGVHHDTVLRRYQGVVYFKTSRGFIQQMLMYFHLRTKTSAAFRAPIFTKSTNAQQHYSQISE
jgi:hypothetical protein